MEKQLLVRLEQAWSSSDVGVLLDASKLNELMALFSFMEPSAKVRFLMALQTAQQEQVKQYISRERYLNPNGNITSTASAGLPLHLLKQILSTADVDSDEWVKIGAGMARKMLFCPPDDVVSEDKDDVLSQSIHGTIEKTLQKVKSVGEGEIAVDDWFSQDLAYLNTNHPKAHFIQKSNDHFTVVEEDKVEKLSQSTPSRSSSIVRRPSTTFSGQSTKLKPPTPTSTLSKRSLTDMSSEIRRQGESGRYKRHRSRISMIDIDEVKQIESVKAQKAEERKQMSRRASSTKGLPPNPVVSSLNTPTGDAEGAHAEGDWGEHAPAASERADPVSGMSEEEGQSHSTISNSRSSDRMNASSSNVDYYNARHTLMQHDVDHEAPGSFHQYHQNHFQEVGMMQQPQSVHDNVAATGESSGAARYQEQTSSFNTYRNHEQSTTTTTSRAPTHLAHSNSTSSYEDARNALLQLQQNAHQAQANIQFNNQTTGHNMEGFNDWRRRM
jgi:hypothetical protein